MNLSEKYEFRSIRKDEADHSIPSDIALQMSPL